MTQKPIILIQISSIDKDPYQLMSEIKNIDEHMNEQFRDEMNIFLVANNIKEDVKIECLNPVPVDQLEYDQVLDRLSKLEKEVRSI